MSMAMLLEGTRDYLREQMPLTAHECDVQFQGTPPAVAGQFFIALEDAGLASGPEESHYLKEIYSIEISIWRRPGPLQRDRWGEFEFRENKYLGSAKTLEKIERSIIELLHHKPAAMVDLNTRFSLPSEHLGENFSSSLRYRGRGGVLTNVLPESPEIAFIGRTLTFSGSMRLQTVPQQK